jgi:hypothetical protein
MLKITQSQVTRQDVFRRAHELRNMNGKTGSHARPFGFWLKLAWAEAREGNTHHWIWLSDDRMLAHLENEYTSAMAEGRDRSGIFAKMSAIRARQSAPLQLAA